MSISALCVHRAKRHMYVHTHTYTRVVLHTRDGASRLARLFNFRRTTPEDYRNCTGRGWESWSSLNLSAKSVSCIMNHTRTHTESHFRRARRSSKGETSSLDDEDQGRERSPGKRAGRAFAWFDWQLRLINLLDELIQVLNWTTIRPSAAHGWN